MSWKQYKIRIENIDYDVTDADVMEYAEYHGLLPLKGENLTKAEAGIRESLPEVIESEVRCESEEDIEDFCADIVSDATGFLINSCTFDIIEVKDIK